MLRFEDARGHQCQRDSPRPRTRRYLSWEIAEWEECEAKTCDPYESDDRATIAQYRRICNSNTNIWDREARHGSSTQRPKQRLQQYGGLGKSGGQMPVNIYALLCMVSKHLPHMRFHADDGGMQNITELHHRSPNNRSISQCTPRRRFHKLTTHPQFQYVSLNSSKKYPLKASNIE